MSEFDPERMKEILAGQEQPPTPPEEKEQEAIRVGPEPAAVSPEGSERLGVSAATADDTNPEIEPQRPKNPGLTEQQYVDREVRVTKMLILEGLKDLDGQRLARCERYARWRYRAYLAGEVGSL